MVLRFQRGRLVFKKYYTSGKKYNIDTAKNETKISLSQIIDLLNSYYNEQSYLLLVNVCAHIPGMSSFLDTPAANGVDRHLIKKWLSDGDNNRPSLYGGYTEKYIKYKTKYLTISKYH